MGDMYFSTDWIGFICKGKEDVSSNLNVLYGEYYCIILLIIEKNENENIKVFFMLHCQEG